MYNYIANNFKSTSNIEFGGAIAKKSNTKQSATTAKNNKPESKPAQDTKKEPRPVKVFPNELPHPITVIDRLCAMNNYAALNRSNFLTYSAYNPQDTLIEVVPVKPGDVMMYTVLHSYVLTDKNTKPLEKPIKQITEYITSSEGCLPAFCGYTNVVKIDYADSFKITKIDGKPVTIIKPGNMGDKSNSGIPKTKIITVNRIFSEQDRAIIVKFKLSDNLKYNYKSPANKNKERELDREADANKNQPEPTVEYKQIPDNTVLFLNYKHQNVVFAQIPNPKKNIEVKEIGILYSENQDEYKNNILDYKVINTDKDYNDYYNKQAIKVISIANFRDVLETKVHGSDITKFKIKT